MAKSNTGKLPIEEVIAREGPIFRAGKHRHRYRLIEIVIWPRHGGCPWVRGESIDHANYTPPCEPYVVRALIDQVEFEEPLFRNPVSLYQEAGRAMAKVIQERGDQDPFLRTLVLNTHARSAEEVPELGKVADQIVDTELNRTLNPNWDVECTMKRP